MKILFVTYGLPYPPDSGARMHDFHLIRRVSREARVLVCSLAPTARDRSLAAEMEPYCEVVEVHEEPPRTVWRHLTDLVRGVWAGRPLAVHPYYFPRLAARIRDIILRHDVDLVQIEHSFLAGYRDAVPPGHRCRSI